MKDEFINNSMTDKDDILINKFFAEQKQIINDDGFSRRVMRKLPSKISCYSRIWSTVCLLAALLLFVTCHGFKLIINCLDVILRTTPTHSIFDCSPLAIAIAIVTLGGVGIYSLVMAER
jgi:hypothetical protein